VLPPGKWFATAPVLLLPLLLGACSGGGDDASLSMDGLRDTGDTCPVELDAAVVDAGLASGEGAVDVEVTEGSGTGDAEDSAIDQVGGVYVECRRAVDDGDVTAVVFASDQPQAIGLMLPTLQNDLDLAADDLEPIVDQLGDTDAGELLDLGGDARAAAAPVDVDGAESAVLYVSASSATPQQTQAIAEQLLDAF
jgi:hypothetical protein